jgi:hypothetical protein
LIGWYFCSFAKLAQGELRYGAKLPVDRRIEKTDFGEVRLDVFVNSTS